MNTSPAPLEVVELVPARRRPPVRLAVLAGGDDGVAPDDVRPRTRGECLDGPRPCPWVSCRYHLGREVRGPMTETCALDVADRGGATLEEVGAVLGVSRERIRQIEAAALRKVERALESMDMHINVGRTDVMKPNDAATTAAIKQHNPRSPTEHLTAKECEKLRDLIARLGEADARQRVGNLSAVTLHKAAAGLPVARLTAQVIRGNLDRL